MRPTTLLCLFSTAVASLNVDERYAEERRAWIEARALTTLYTTSVVYSTVTSKTTTCSRSLANICILSATKTVTTTVAVKTTTVPYTTKSVPDSTSSVKATSTTTTSSAKTSSTTTSSSKSSQTSSTKASSTVSQSTQSSTATATGVAEPTCGLTGWEISGTNIGYYTTIPTYSQCNDLCNSNANCLSLAYATSLSNGTCVLYNHLAEGNVTADSTSPYTYFDRGSVCPKASTTSSTATASSTTPATPSFTAGVQYCPSGYTKYNVSAPVAGYTGCNSTYAGSTCASGVDGSALCNLCDSCYNATTCTSTAGCQSTYGAGYACVSGSACVSGGASVCLYMLAGGDAHGCYGSHSS